MAQYSTTKPKPPHGYTAREWDEFLLAVELGSIFPCKAPVIQLSESDCRLRALVAKQVELEKPRPQPAEEPKPKKPLTEKKKAELAELAAKARASKIARQVLKKSPRSAKEILGASYYKPPAL